MTTESDRVSTYVRAIARDHPDWDAAAFAHAAARVFCQPAPHTDGEPETATARDAVAAFADACNTAGPFPEPPDITGLLAQIRDAVQHIVDNTRPAPPVTTNIPIHSPADVMAGHARNIESAVRVATEQPARGAGSREPLSPLAEIVVDRDGDAWARTRTHRRWVCLTSDSDPQYQEDLEDTCGPLKPLVTTELDVILRDWRAHAKQRAQSQSGKHASALLSAREAVDRAAAGIAQALATASYAGPTT